MSAGKKHLSWVCSRLVCMTAFSVVKFVRLRVQLQINHQGNKRAQPCMLQGWRYSAVRPGLQPAEFWGLRRGTIRCGKLDTSRSHRQRQRQMRLEEHDAADAGQGVVGGRQVGRVRRLVRIALAFQQGHGLGSDASSGSESGSVSMSSSHDTDGSGRIGSGQARELEDEGSQDEGSEILEDEESEEDSLNSHSIEVNSEDGNEDAESSADDGKHAAWARIMFPPS